MSFMGTSFHYTPALICYQVLICTKHRSVTPGWLSTPLLPCPRLLAFALLAVPKSDILTSSWLNCILFSSNRSSSLSVHPLVRLSVEPLPHHGLCLDEHFYSPEYTWSVGMLTYNNQKFVKLSLFIIQWGEYWKGANKGETLNHEASGADLQGLQLSEHHQGKKCGDEG